MKAQWRHWTDPRAIIGSGYVIIVTCSAPNNYLGNDIMSIWHVGINVSVIWIEMQKISSTKLHLKCGL